MKTVLDGGGAIRIRTRESESLAAVVCCVDSACSLGSIRSRKKQDMNRLHGLDSFQKSVFAVITAGTCSGVERLKKSIRNRTMRLHATSQSTWQRRVDAAYTDGVLVSSRRSCCGGAQQVLYDLLLLTRIRKGKMHVLC